MANIGLFADQRQCQSRDCHLRLVQSVPLRWQSPQKCGVGVHCQFEGDGFPEEDDQQACEAVEAPGYQVHDLDHHDVDASFKRRNKC